MGENDQQWCEEVVDKAGVWGDVNRRDVINKAEHKGHPPKHIHINKEVPTRQNYCKISHDLSGKSQWLAASLQ